MPPPSEHCSKRCGVGEKCRTGRHNNKWPDEATADARTTRESAHYRLADLGDVGRQSVTRDAVDIALAKLSFDLLLVLIRTGAERRLEPIYSATRVDAITTHYSQAELSNLI